MRKLATILAAGLLTLPQLAAAQTAYPTPPIAPAPGAPMPPVAGQPGIPGAQHGREGHHPEMHKAMRHLEAAKQELQHAAHDYSGHRDQALHLIDQAEAQIQQGLAAEERR